MTLVKTAKIYKKNLNQLPVRTAL